MILLALLSLPPTRQPLPLAQIQAVEQVQWQPAETGMGECPAFTHLHDFGTELPERPDYKGDGECHLDTDDSVWDSDQVPPFRAIK